MKNNSKLIVKYYYHILKYLDNSPSAAATNSDNLTGTRAKLGRKFTLAPICSIRSHFITIDTEGIWPIMKLYGDIKIKYSEVRERRDEIFRQLFKIDKRKNFDYCITTLCLYALLQR